MVELQQSFINFHDSIKLDYDDNTLLRDYRDQVLKGLKENLNSDYTFDTFIQGSYSVYTGIKSSDENIDFDIDVAIAFKMSTDDCTNPVIAKKWIRDAMQETFPSATIEIKTPCVTINFTDDADDKQVHVDVAVYANNEEIFYLAKGKEFSLAENKIWERADPKGLKEKINTFSENSDDRAQFRRCIRYLKRWKDNKFKQENRPTGIGITVLALENFKANKTKDWMTEKETYNDLKALSEFTNLLILNFNKLEYDDKNGCWYNRIEAKLPVQPYSDTFCKMSANQMNDFKSKLESLKNDLEFSIKTLDKHEATKKLNTHFGPDFEIIEENQVVESSLKNSFVSDYPSA
ncbi:nucleotidyltransferase [Enterococcus casseliflavus]|uniref:nucleotidyltransferase domain-containing protein n=1 Tax=Enterococcus casseliflavus TaxID=37734 RepID=UPI001C45904F|nr:nucleotidyltransferase [Enterococcus casseliflavus]MBV6375476.1 nucleotidyltransferase [Enterococcus casseliflavus]